MRGAIAEISGSKAIMLTESGEFISLRNKNYSVGQKVIVSKKAYSKFSALVACFILFVMIGGGVWGYYTPVSYVDIDINPSFRLEFNIFDRIINVEPLNKDAGKFLEMAESLPQNMEECMTEIIEKAKKYGYINEDNSEIYIYSISSKKEFLTKLNNYAKNISDRENVQIYANSEKQEVLKAAKEHNVSVGRIKLIDEYTKVHGGTIDSNVAIFTGKTNKEIRTTIAEQSKQETPANVESDKIKRNSRKSLPENIPEKSNASNDNVVTDKDKSQKKSDTKNENAQEKNNKAKENSINSISENIPEKSNSSNDNVVTDKDKSQKKSDIKNENAQEKNNKAKENSINSISENIPQKSNLSNDNVITDEGKSQKKPEMENENIQGKSNKEKSNNGNSKNHGNKK